MSTKTKNPYLPGKVKAWKMTESERLAYIAKHPIKQYEKKNDYIYK